MRNYGDQNIETRVADAVASICRDVYLVSPQECDSCQRGVARAAECRQALCYYLLRETTWSVNRVAVYIKRCRNTVYYGHKRYMELLDVDRNTQARARSIEARLMQYRKHPLEDVMNAIMQDD